MNDVTDCLIAITREHVRAVVAATSQTPIQEGGPVVPPLALPDETAASPLGHLFERFGLGDHERRMIAVLVTHELDVRTRVLVRELNSEVVPDPTIDTLRRIVYGGSTSIDAWRELGADGELRRQGFVERSDFAADLSTYRQTLRASNRILALVHGDLSLDPVVAALGAVFEAPPLDALVIDPDSLKQIVAGFDASPGLVVVKGRAGLGRRSVLAALANERGFRILAIDGHRLAKDRELARRQLRAVSRECRLLDLVPLIQNLDALIGAAETERLDVFEEELSGLVLATSAGSLARRWKRPPTIAELVPPNGAARMILWRRAIPAAGDGDADILSTLYPLAPALIQEVGAAAIHAAADAKMEPAHVEAGLRVVLDDRLAGLAARVNVTQTWDDLILPDEQATAVTELLSRIRKRRQVYETWGFAQKVGKGLGVSALFSGPPGTGKTMCAGLIARELRTELYQVDVSKMSSKWIGETEKNLAALFDAAEAGHAILLFDEADSLFGKRTEVRSSNDRHANQETGYLLQRLESYTGICVLTTNHESAIDDAFRRRLSVHVRLPVPDVDERRRLWQALIPKSAPVDPKLDVTKLADKYVMTGGYIRNAVLRAAFLAADEETAITTLHLTRAAQLEYEAMGKLVTSN